VVKELDLRFDRCSCNVLHTSCNRYNSAERNKHRVWCFLYLAIAAVFDGLVVVALLYQHVDLTQMLLGVSAGAATGLGLHVTHHIFEEGESSKSSSGKK